MIRRLAGLILMSALAWSFVAAPAFADRRPQINVEVDVFSGKPNPSWQLDAVQARLVLRMLGGLRRSGRGGRTCVPPSLGYRGLTMTVIEGDRTSTWRVFDQCIEHNGQAFDDAGARVQAFILQSVPRALKSDLVGVALGVNR